MLIQPVSFLLALATLSGTSSARVDFDPIHLYEFNRELTRSLQGRPGPSSLLPATFKNSPWFREAKSALRKAKNVARLVSEEDSVCLVSPAGRVCWLPTFAPGVRKTGRGIRFRGIDITFFPPEEPDEKAYRTAIAKFIKDVRGTRAHWENPSAPQATAENADAAEKLPPYLVQAMMATYQGWRWISDVQDSRTGSPVRYPDAVELLVNRGRGSPAGLTCRPDGPVMKLRGGGGELELRDNSPLAAHGFDDKDFIVLSKESERFRIRLRPARAYVKCADAWTGLGDPLCDIPVPKELFEVDRCRSESCGDVAPATVAEKTALAGAGSEDGHSRLLDFTEDLVDTRVAAVCCHFDLCKQAVDELNAGKKK